MVVWPLAIAETIIWASCYYVFPALLLEWEGQLGWSKTALAGGFTTALVFSALLAPLVGRLIDHGLAKYVLTGCALFAVLLLVLLSQVTQFWQFFMIWIGMGIAMAGVLYEAAFAVLTRTMGPGAKKAITFVTLIAGFAGTLSFPAAHFLSSLYGWRVAVLFFAYLVLFVAIPLLWTACRYAEDHHASLPDKPDIVPGKAAAMLRRPAFWLLAFGFTTLAVNHGGIVSHLLPLLQERNIDPQTAVLAASMLGPMQVTGRLAMMVLEKHVSIFAVGYSSFLAMSLASVVLLLASNVPELVAGFVILQGAGHGVVSIIRPVITARLLGKANFGVISGMLALPYMLGFAFGPAMAALVWRSGGYDLVLIVTLALAVSGLATFFAAKQVA